MSTFSAFYHRVELEGTTQEERLSQSRNSLLSVNILCFCSSLSNCPYF